MKVFDGQKINDLMAKSNWTRNKLVLEFENAGDPISLATLANWINGTTTPSGKRIATLCNLFNCSPSKFITEVK